MEIVPEGTIDPTPSIQYNDVRHGWVVGYFLFAGILMRPVHEKHHYRGDVEKQNPLEKATDLTINSFKIYEGVYGNVFFSKARYLRGRKVNKKTCSENIFLIDFR